jgi:hypothetical protein
MCMGSSARPGPSALTQLTAIAKGMGAPQANAMLRCANSSASLRKSRISADPERACRHDCFTRDVTS